MSVDIQSKVPIKTIYSPSHQIYSRKKNDHAAVAGFETSASTLTFMFYRLSLQPEVRALDASERQEIWSHLPTTERGEEAVAAGPRYWKIAPPMKDADAPIRMNTKEKPRT